MIDEKTAHGKALYEIHTIIDNIETELKKLFLFVESDRDINNLNEVKNIMKGFRPKKLSFKKEFERVLKEEKEEKEENYDEFEDIDITEVKIKIENTVFTKITNRFCPLRNGSCIKECVAMQTAIYDDERGKKLCCGAYFITGVI